MAPAAPREGTVGDMNGGSPLVTKLAHFVQLSGEDVRVLDALCVKEECFEAGTDIVLDGDVPRSRKEWHSATGFCPTANGRFWPL